MKSNSWRLSLGLLVLLPTWAAAHTGVDAAHHHGFMAGFLHPFTGIDHLVAMLAVGVWSALVARRWWLPPLSFAALLLLGAGLAAAGVQVPAVEPVVAASLLALGLLVALRTQWSVAGMAALVGGFALFHGLAHGSELSGGSALAGMVLATALLHAAGVGIGWQLRARSAWWSRALGMATMATGAALLLGGVWA